VDDIGKGNGAADESRIYFASKAPFLGGAAAVWAFMHPKSTNGVLVELSQHIEPKKGGKYSEDARPKRKNISFTKDEDLTRREAE